MAATDKPTYVEITLELAVDAHAALRMAQEELNKMGCEHDDADRAKGSERNCAVCKVNKVVDALKSVRLRVLTN